MRSGLWGAWAALCFAAPLHAQPLPPPRFAAPLPSSPTFDLSWSHAQARAGTLAQTRDALSLGAWLGLGCDPANSTPCAVLGAASGLEREALSLSLPDLQLERPSLGWAGLDLHAALAVWRWRGDGGARAAWLWTLDAHTSEAGLGAWGGALELRSWGPYHAAGLRVGARPPTDEDGAWSSEVSLWLRPCARAWRVCADGLVGLQRDGELPYARLGAGLSPLSSDPDDPAGLGLWVERLLGEDGADGLPTWLGLRWRGSL